MKKILSMALCMALLCTGIPAEVFAAEDAQADIVYAPEVEKELLDDAKDYTLEKMGEGCEVLIPKTEESAQVTAGDNIILPANEENPGGEALTVTGVAEEDGNLVWTCEEPRELSDFIRSIDVSGYGEFLPEQAAGGLPSICARGIGVDLANQSSQLGRIEYEFSNTVLQDAGVLNGTVSVEISSLEYRLKMDVGLRQVKVEDFYFAVNHTADLSADFTFDTEGLETGGVLKLGTVPFILGQTGVNGELTFWLEYDVNGHVKVDYTFSNTVGITYENGSCKPFAQNGNTLAALAGLDFSVGPKMQFVLKYGSGIILTDVTVCTGVSGKADILSEYPETDEAGYQGEAFAYLLLHPGEQGIVNQTLGMHDMEVWNRDSSPYHVACQGIF